MTCIGHESSAILSDHAHMLCAHQPTHEAHFVRSKSYQRSLFLSVGAAVGFAELLEH